jgi:hypothetical protein
MDLLCTDKLDGRHEADCKKVYSYTEIWYMVFAAISRRRNLHFPPQSQSRAELLTFRKLVISGVQTITSIFKLHVFVVSSARLETLSVTKSRRRSWVFFSKCCCSSHKQHCIDLQNCMVRKTLQLEMADHFLGFDL